MNHSRPSPLFWILILACVLVAPWGGSGSLDRAEVYFMDGARSMVERSDYLVPYYRGGPFFDKPPLTYWLQALSFQVWGPTPAAARLVSAVAALVTLVATYWLGLLLFERRTAIRGAWMLLTTYPFLSFAHTAMSDMLMTALAMSALTLAWAIYRRPNKSALTILLALILGLAFLTKGPIAVLLPGIGILWMLFILRAQGRPVSYTTLAFAALVFLTVSASWFVAVYIRLGAEPLRYFFFQENLQRFAGATYESNYGPWFYLATYLTQGWPWSLFIPLAVITAIRGLPPTAAQDRWLSLTISTMLIPLSLSRGKLDYYLLPVYPLASLLLSSSFAQAAARVWTTWGRAIAVVGICGLLAIALAPIGIPGAWLPSLQGLLLFYIVLFGMLLLMLASLRKGARGAIVTSLGLTTVFLFSSFMFVWMPAFGAGQPNRQIVADVVRETRYRPELQLALRDDPSRVQREIIFETNIPIYEFENLWGPVSSPHSFLVLMRAEEWDSFKNLERIRLVNEYAYIPPNALNLTRLLRPLEVRRLILAANFRSDDPVAIERVRIDRRLRYRQHQLKEPALTQSPPTPGMAP
ncbi:MAG: glycosyltransferase family 39 protein [Vicinamibacteria bacterium]|nr:glycosyltransferase family 39 protein [Vicinamibacteria bacterium]